MKESLRKILHSDVTRSQKALCLLYVNDGPATITALKRIASENGLRVPSGWNLSTTLARTKGQAISTPRGWELTEGGRLAVEALGLSRRTPAVAQTLVNLRAEIAALGSADTRRFLEEAVACLEAGHYRAAVVMSWVAAVHLIQAVIVQSKLPQFNAEALRRDARWKTASKEEDLSRMKESDLLDIAEAIGVFGKDVKQELKGCLTRRNSCGHPNDYIIRELTASHHVETLTVNAFRALQG